MRKCEVRKCGHDASHVHFIKRDEVVHICDRHREMKPFNMVKKAKVLSWMPSQDSDVHYPEKDVVILTQGKTGYHATDWKMSREAVVERKRVQGLTEVDRERADHFSCFGYDMREVT